MYTDGYLDVGGQKSQVCIPLQEGARVPATGDPPPWQLGGLDTDRQRRGQPPTAGKGAGGRPRPTSGMQFNRHLGVIRAKLGANWGQVLG